MMYGYLVGCVQNTKHHTTPCCFTVYSNRTLFYYFQTFRLAVWMVNASFISQRKTGDNADDLYRGWNIYLMLPRFLEYDLDTLLQDNSLKSIIYFSVFYGLNITQPCLAVRGTKTCSVKSSHQHWRRNIYVPYWISKTWSQSCIIWIDWIVLNPTETLLKARLRKIQLLKWTA